MPSWYYEKADLARTPSIKSGLSLAQERTYRKEGASYIMELGNYLQLHYVTCATACTFFHRFYMFHSFNEYSRYLMATACLFLAGKVEETPKKWKVVWKAATEVLKEDQLVGFEGFDHKLLTYERILLQAIQFDLIVEHPHQYITKYAKTLKGNKEKVEKLVQIAWNFANDSLRTTLCLEWEPPIIAIAFLQLAGKFNVVDLNAMQGNPKRNWWINIFDDLCEDLLEDICHQVLDLYHDNKSGNKLKQDSKKKRHSSKIAPDSSHSRSASNTPSTSSATDRDASSGAKSSRSSDDPAKKKSRHSKQPPSTVSPLVATSKAVAPSAASSGVTPAAVVSCASSTTFPQNAQTVYFAAAQTNQQQGGQPTVIMYYQPMATPTPNMSSSSATNSSTTSNSNIVYSLPQTLNNSSNPSSVGAVQASNNNSGGTTQHLNGFPNMFYQMPGHVIAQPGSKGVPNTQTAVNPQQPQHASPAMPTPFMFPPPSQPNIIPVSNNFIASSNPAANSALGSVPPPFPQVKPPRTGQANTPNGKSTNHMKLSSSPGALQVGSPFGMSHSIASTSSGAQSSNHLFYQNSQQHSNNIESAGNKVYSANMNSSQGLAAFNLQQASANHQTYPQNNNNNNSFNHRRDSNGTLGPRSTSKPPSDSSSYHKQNWHHRHGSTAQSATTSNHVNKNWTNFN